MQNQWPGIVNFLHNVLIYMHFIMWEGCLPHLNLRQKWRGRGAGKIKVDKQDEIYYRLISSCLLLPS